MKNILLIIFTFVIVSSAKSYDFSALCSSGQTLYYTITSIENKTVKVVPQNNVYPYYDYENIPTGNFSIPESVVYNNINYLITGIDDYAFYHCSKLNGSLIFPNSIVSIGNHAFDRCIGFSGNLTLPLLLTSIGNYAFNYCIELTGNLIIPNSVVSIGDNAFENCSKLTGSLVLSTSLTSVGNYAFKSCIGLTGDLTIPNTITTIGIGTFSDCTGLNGNLKLPINLESIGSMAFKKCYAFKGNLILPASTISIGSEAFSNCSNFSGSVSISKSLISIGNSAFEHCSEITSFDVDAENKRYSSSEGIIYTCLHDTLIACPNKKSGNLIIPASITTIGAGAFAGCSNLTGSLTIPNSVIKIEYDAFYNCSGFTSLTIPASVTSIDEHAFYNCLGIKSIYVQHSIPVDLTLSNFVFNGIDKTSCILYVPTGSKSTYQTKEYWKDFINIIEISTSLSDPNNTAINLYPNPIIEYLNVGSDINLAEYELIIHSITGNLTKQFKLNSSHKIYVGDLKAGIYFISLRFNNNIIAKKLMTKLNN